MIINYSDQEVLKNKKSIFLAGPTPRGENVKSWRTDACNKLKELGFDAVVYVPQYSTWKPKSDYIDQACGKEKLLLKQQVLWITKTKVKFKMLLKILKDNILY